jgi:LmbE family N-acetylglucosaminyl deacetylase
MEDTSLTEKSILVFAPHPDDETLGCGGTIANRVREGHEVEIFFMTDGRTLERGVLCRYDSDIA